jgi:hypothetical protein
LGTLGVFSVSLLAMVDILDRDRAADIPDRDVSKNFKGALSQDDLSAPLAAQCASVPFSGFCQHASRGMSHRIVRRRV